jgi:hypothetical protein
VKCEKERSKADQVPSKISCHVSSMTQMNVSFLIERATELTDMHECFRWRLEPVGSWRVSVCCRWNGGWVQGLAGRARFNYFSSAISRISDQSSTSHIDGGGHIFL